MVQQSFRCGEGSRSIKTTTRNPFKRSKEPSDPADRESKFQRKLKKKLDSIPDSYFFVKEAKAIRGIPDIIGVMRGRFIALEVKKNEAEAKQSGGRIALQKYVLTMINKAGGYGAVIYPENEQEILSELEKIFISLENFREECP
jgi:hypothetical protein